MAANQVLKKYFCSSNIKIPAGVRYIEVNPIYATNSVISAMRSGAGTNVFIKNSEGYIGSIGENAVGQQGLGNITSPISTVSPVTSNLAYKLLTSGGSSFLIDKKGSLFSTGLNTRGQLGTGDVVTKSSFTSVLGSLKYVNIFK